MSVCRNELLWAGNCLIEVEGESKVCGATLGRVSHSPPVYFAQLRTHEQIEFRANAGFSPLFALEALAFMCHVSGITLKAAGVRPDFRIGPGRGAQVGRVGRERCHLFAYD